MKFRVQVTDDDPLGKRVWWENYDTSTSAPRNLPWDDDPQVWAQKAVDRFNLTLREYELPRRLLKVEILDESGKVLVSHSWDKVSLTGVSDPRIKGGRIFDRVRCTRCGDTNQIDAAVREWCVDDYIKALYIGFLGRLVYDPTADNSLFALTTATPEQKCRALIAAAEELSK